MLEYAIISSAVYDQIKRHVVIKQSVFFIVNKCILMSDYEKMLFKHFPYHFKVLTIYFY